MFKLCFGQNSGIKLFFESRGNVNDDFSWEEQAIISFKQILESRLEELEKNMDKFFQVCNPQPKIMNTVEYLFGKTLPASKIQIKL